ncbi:hypothetical protein J6590_101524 [Homalodisca vitripennis]|nr:hypothetical protein J6590_101524 [Homalodisca vitripennis]
MAAVGEGMCIYNEGYLLTMTQLLDQVGLSPGASTASHAKKRDSDRLRLRKARARGLRESRVPGRPTQILSLLQYRARTKWQHTGLELDGLRAATTPVVTALAESIFLMARALCIFLITLWARQGSVVPHVDCPHLWSRHRNCFTLLTCAVLRHCFAMECQEEKLIEMVRVYPVLYDTSDGKYMKTKYKQEIWGKIAKELNIADGKGLVIS